MRQFIRKKPVTIQQVSYYTSIHKLPLARFLDALIDKDLRALIIEGEPTEADLQAAWDSILDQYGDALGGRANEHYLRLCAKYNKLQSKYAKAILLIDILKKCYVKEFADMLINIVGRIFRFDYTNREAYLKDLESCTSLAGAIQLRMWVTEGEIEAIVKSTTKTAKEPTRDDFYKTLVTLSDYAGRDFDIETMTVFNYCERLRRYNDYVERKLQEQQKTVRA